MKLQHLAQTPIKPSRVVVVGSGGFVGGAVCRRLIVAGIDVLCLGRAELDLLDDNAPDVLKSFLLPDDAVVFTAARAPCRNLDMLIENARMTKTLVAALKDAPISHVVNISSDAVYADEPVPISEETPAAPATLHGAMHLAREIAIRNELDVPLTILRPTLLYGLEDPHNGYGPNRFRRLAGEGNNIVLFGGGEERRDHVFIDDLAEIVLRVLTHRSVGALNIATGEVHSFRVIADLISAASSRNILIEETPRNGPMPHNGYRPFEITALRAAFPDFEYVKLPQGIQRLQELAEL